MDPFFRMLHVVGLVLWFSTLGADVFFLTAAKRSPDLRLKAWACSSFARALRLELIGLGLLLAGAIGMLVLRGWWPWEFRWLFIKSLAGLLAILARAYAYSLCYARFRSAVLPQDAEGLEKHLGAAIRTWDSFNGRAAAPVYAALFLVLVMVFWKPL